MRSDGLPNTEVDDRQSQEEMPYSVVLLLRDPTSLSESTLQIAAERGWQRSFDGNDDPMFFVSVAGEHAFVKAGQNIIKVLAINQPYFGDPKGIAIQLPREEQKTAWQSHRAWMALDFWNLEKPKSDAYEMLARLALPLLDLNCCGCFSRRKKFSCQMMGLLAKVSNFLLNALYSDANIGHWRGTGFNLDSFAQTVL